jgi:hypothetical protein
MIRARCSIESAAALTPRGRNGPASNTPSVVTTAASAPAEPFAMGVTAMTRTVNDNDSFQTTHKYMVPLRGTVINESVFETLGSAHDFSATALLSRDYKRCAETMIGNYGPDAFFRAERRARHMLVDENHDGYDIWTRVAATIRWIR